MTTVRLSALGLMHPYNDIAIDGDAVAPEFCGKNIKLDQIEIISSAFSPVVLGCTLQSVVASNQISFMF